VRQKFTTRTLDALKPRATQYSLGDTGCAGLCVRVTPSGTKTFAFTYRAGANTRWMTLGRYPEITLAKAHELVADARKTLAAGGTPTTPKIEADEKKSLTYTGLVDLYHNQKLSKLRSGHKIRATLDKIGRRYRWNDRPAVSITKYDAGEMLRHIVASGHAPMANRTKEMAHAMFRWAQRQDLITVNPFYDIGRPGGEDVQRKRFLSTAEIRMVWRALDEPERFRVSRDAAAALRLILATACRPGMAAGIEGAELHDLRGPSKAGPHWLLPAERMKMGDPFVAPLSRLAVEILDPYLEKAKATPAARLFRLGPNVLQQAARRLSAGLGMSEAFRPHDLRRTAATHLGRADYEDTTIGHLLAHDRKTVTRGYVQDKLWKHFSVKTQMVQVIEHTIRAAIAEEPVAAAA
jgi:integrase